MATVGRPRRPDASSRTVAVALLSAWCLLGAHKALADTWRVVPSASVRGTWTDNVELTPNDSKQSSFVIELIPAVQVDATGKRLKLNLNYQLDGVIDTRDAARSEIRNQLSAAGMVEAVEDFLFVDFSGNISQQVLSPFGPRPVGGANFSSNRVETRAYQVSPYVRGRFPTGEYTVRFTESGLRTDAGVDDSQIHQLLVRVNSDPTLRAVNWVLEGQSERIDFTTARDTRDDQLRGSIIYTVNGELRVAAIGGAERNNFSSLSLESYGIYGAAFVWRPSDITDAHARWEHRFFGSSWEYGASHRRSRLAFTFTGTQNISTDAQRLGAAASGIAYDLVFTALTSRFPDPAERAIEARRLLQSGGIPADLNLPADFLTGGVFVERQQNASIALLGARNSTVFAVYRSNRRQFRRNDLPVDVDLPADDVTEYGSSIAFSHRLTPLSSLTAIGTWRRTTSNVTNGDATSRQWDARLLYATQLGRHASGTFEIRHVRFYGAAGQGTDYTENAATATLSFTF